LPCRGTLVSTQYTAHRQISLRSGSVRQTATEGLDQELVAVLIRNASSRMGLLSKKLDQTCGLLEQQRVAIANYITAVQEAAYGYRAGDFCCPHPLPHVTPKLLHWTLSIPSPSLADFELHVPTLHGPRDPGSFLSWLDWHSALCDYKTSFSINITKIAR
jgi:hypothetical protein